MSKALRELPIFDQGDFTPNPEATVIGFMCFPNCPRSAAQFAQLLVDEIRAPNLDPQFKDGELLALINRQMPYVLMNLVGEMTLDFLRLYLCEGTVSKSKAAWITQERRTDEVTDGGKRLPANEKRLRNTFNKTLAVAHLWGAANIARVDESGGISNFNVLTDLWLDRPKLVQFLANAAILQNILQSALPEAVLLSIPFELTRHLDPSVDYSIRILTDSPTAQEALASYHARSGL